MIERIIDSVSHHELETSISDSFTKEHGFIRFRENSKENDERTAGNSILPCSNNLNSDVINGLNIEKTIYCTASSARTNLSPPVTDVPVEKPKAPRSPPLFYPRHQSPSPNPVCIGSVANRQLPGGLLLPHRSRQSMIRPTPISHKKEIRKIKKKENEPCEFRQIPPQLVDNEAEQAVSDNDSNISLSEIRNMANQADPNVMSLECQLIPFVRNLREIELRLSSVKMSKLHRRILKILAAEYELVVLPISKIPSDCSTLVIRKKASLLEKQRIELEKIETKAKEVARLKMLEEEKRLQSLREAELLQSLPSFQDTCCQTNLEAPVQELSRKKQKRLRRERRRLAKLEATTRKPKPVDKEMQTVPEDYWLCTWCLQHIAPDAQCGHEAICRAGVKQREKALELKARLAQRNADADARKRQRLGLPPLRKSKNTAPPVPEAVSGRSRNRNQSAPRKKDKNKSTPAQGRPRTPSKSGGNHNQATTVAAKLDLVHPNDLGAMARLMQRMCSEPKCNQLADAGEASGRSGLKCPKCHLIFCDHHRPVEMHSVCVKVDPNVDGPDHSIACGMDSEEKRSMLKAAIRGRKAIFRENRQRC